jgi:hypothetical protein
LVCYLLKWMKLKLWSGFHVCLFVSQFWFVIRFPLISFRFRFRYGFGFGTHTDKMFLLNCLFVFWFVVRFPVFVLFSFSN